MTLLLLLLACVPHPGARLAEPAPEAPASIPSTDAILASERAFAEANSLLDEGRLTEARDRYREIVESWPGTPAVGTAQRRLFELQLVGTRAPQLETERWFLGHLDWAETPTTLVVFFETWCPHCQHEMPAIEALAERWQGRLAVLGLTRITREATDETVRAFITEHQLSFPIAKERGDTMSIAFAVEGIPAAALIHDGRIVWRGHPSRLNDTLLEVLLGG